MTCGDGRCRVRLDGQLESRMRGLADVAMVQEVFGESGAESEWVGRQSRLDEGEVALVQAVHGASNFGLRNGHVMNVPPGWAGSSTFTSL